MESEIHAGVEELLAEPNRDLEGVGTANAVCDLLAVLVEEIQADVGGLRRRHHSTGGSQAIVHEQDARALGPKRVEDLLPHDVDHRLTRTSELLPHVEQPAASEAEETIHRAAKAVADEREVEIADPLHRVLGLPQHGVERIENDRWVANHVHQRRVGANDALRVVELRREDLERVAKQVGVLIEHRLPLGERLAASRRQPRLPKLQKRCLRVVDLATDPLIVAEVGDAEVEARGALLQGVVLARLGRARRRERRGRELVEDRHHHVDLAEERRRVIGDIEGGELARAWLHIVGRRRRRTSGPGERDHELAIIDLRGAPLHEHAKPGRERKVLAVDVHVNLERCAIGDAMRGAAVEPIEEGLTGREIDADGEHARGVEHDGEGRLAVGIGQFVDALRHETAEFVVIRREVQVETDLLRHARVIGEVDAVGLPYLVERDDEVAGRKA